MTTYKGINGTAVQNFAGDPTNPIEGQVWYDSVAATFQYSSVTTAGAWSTGGNLNTARYFAQNGAGTQTTALVFGGQTPTSTAITESYNGSAWTEVNDLNTVRFGTGAGGTQTSALLAGGQAPSPVNSTSSESWNGTSWTATPSLNLGRQYLAGAIDVNTAGIVFGGLIAPGFTNARAETELWNGSVWAEVNDLNTARRSLPGVGSSIAGLAMGGYNTAATAVANTESYNGTCWAEVADQSTVGGASFGTQSSALKNNGTTTEIWNGTSWSTTTSASSPASNRSGVGTSSLGLLAGGETGGAATVATTEEWIGAGSPLIQTFTDS